MSRRYEGHATEQDPVRSRRIREREDDERTNSDAGRMRGRVVRVKPEFCFVKGTDGNDRFLHRNAMRSGHRYDELEANSAPGRDDGTLIEFTPTETDKGLRAIDAEILPG